MKYINKQFNLPSTIKYLESKQKNGDILFILRNGSLSTSYGNTERDTASLKHDIVALFIAREGCLYWNNANGFTPEYKAAGEQIERDYKSILRFIEGGNATIVDEYLGGGKWNLKNNLPQ